MAPALGCGAVNCAVLPLRVVVWNVNRLTDSKLAAGALDVLSCGPPAIAAFSEVGRTDGGARWLSGYTVFEHIAPDSTPGKGLLLAFPYTTSPTTPSSCTLPPPSCWCSSPTVRGRPYCRSGSHTSPVPARPPLRQIAALLMCMRKSVPCCRICHRFPCYCAGTSIRILHVTGSVPRSFMPLQPRLT